MPLIRKIRELLTYIVAGLAVVGGLLLLAGLPHVWYLFVCFSVLLVAALAKMYWSARRSLKVWLLLAAFMIVHCIFYVGILRHVENFPAFLYIITCPIEIMLFATIAKLWLNILPPTARL